MQRSLSVCRAYSVSGIVPPTAPSDWLQAERVTANQKWKLCMHSAHTIDITYVDASLRAET